eukprot:g8618.t1
MTVVGFGKAAASSASPWDTKKHIAYSHVAHLGVDNVLFALRLRASSMDAAAAANKSIITSSMSEDCRRDNPAIRGRINRDKERAKREAKRKVTAEAARARLGDHDSTGLEDPAAEASLLLELDYGSGPCINKSCVRRGPMEDKLLAKWEQVKAELGGKIKGVQKLRRSVDETEKKRDSALEEITALKEAAEAEVASAAERKKYLQAVESEVRTVSEETQRLEVQLRKLRVRYQEEAEVRLPMPHGSIISEAEAWAAAAAAALSDREDDSRSPRPPPFAPDGLTVSFARPRCERERLQYETGYPLSGKGLKRASKEHSGNFGRWGPDAREQWSCCLWEEKEGEAPTNTDGNNTRGGSNTRSSRRRRSGVANGCDAVQPHPSPGGMTTADDVHLVWGGSQCNNLHNASITTSIENSKVRNEAWGTGSGEGGDDRALWKPMLASRIRGSGGAGGSAGGAAWSLIRQRPRPQTANARMGGRRTAAAAVTACSGGSKNDEIPSEKDKKAAAGFGVTARRDVVGNSSRRRLANDPSRPGSAPPPGKRTNHAHQAPVKRQSSLVSRRSARTRAGWQRKCPLPVGSGNDNSNGLRRNPPAGSSGNNAMSGGGRGVASGAWHSRSLLSLNGVGSTYTVYSKGEERAAAVTPVGDAATRRWRDGGGRTGVFGGRE